MIKSKNQIVVFWREKITQEKKEKIISALYCGLQTSALLKALQ